MHEIGSNGSRRSALPQLLANVIEEANTVRKLRVAMDIGGTFTDLIAYDEETHELICREDSIDASGFHRWRDGRAEQRRASSPSEIVDFKHGSTIATNAIIERRGAKTGLSRPRDARRARRRSGEPARSVQLELGPVAAARPAATMCSTVDERIDYEGRVLPSLTRTTCETRRASSQARGIESVAIAYLNSFMNPDHELRTKEILEDELGDGVYVCTSSEITA